MDLAPIRSVEVEHDNKLSIRHNRTLEAEEGESDKHEADIQEMDAKHAENQANVATSKVLNILEDETKDIKNQEQKVKTYPSHSHNKVSTIQNGILGTRRFGSRRADNGRLLESPRSRGRSKVEFAFFFSTGSSIFIGR